MGQFDDAVRHALRAGDAHREAVQHVSELIEELGSDVEAALEGVRIEALPPHDPALQPALGNLHRFAAAQLSGSRLGSDPEDSVERQVIVARTGKSIRILWEVRLSKDGYPIKVKSPDESEVMCWSRDELVSEFAAQLKSGVTGRKLQALHAQAQAHAPGGD